MKEVGTLFTAPMIRACIEGRKMVTRRLLKPQPYYRTRTNGRGVWFWERSKSDLLEFINFQGKTCEQLMRSGLPQYLRWQPGDIMVARETFAYYPDADHVIFKAREGNELAALGVDLKGCWKSPRHLPYRFSRYKRLITSVRVERLQDITEEDAIREGLFAQKGDGECYLWRGDGYHGAGYDRHGGMTFHTPDSDGKCACGVGGPSPAQCAYRELWDSINGKGSWASNPWVVRIEWDGKALAVKA